MRKKETITLGSGKLYIQAFAGGDLPTNAEVETDANLIGYIKGGAELEYTPESYIAKDDLGFVSKEVLTSEEAILKTGVMTWNADTLTTLTRTGRSETKDGVTIVKIGGIGNQTGTKYLIVFVHEDKADGDVRIKIVGRNNKGFTLAFKPDEETVIDAEFTALPDLDKDVTLIFLEETAPATPAGRNIDTDALKEATEDEGKGAAKK